MTHSPTHPILILGAGMAGLSAARELTAHGFPVHLVEKSKGLGGRMATRRFAGGTHDTGAQYISARTPEFQNVLGQAAETGAVKVWAHGFSMQHEPPMIGHPRYCGTSGMTSLPKYMAEGLEINQGWEVASIEKTPEGFWLLKDSTGQQLLGSALVITAPAPQALNLLSPIEAHLLPEAFQDLRQVQYDPCIAVALSLDHPTAVPPPGAMFVTKGKLRWIADNQQKGISETPSLTLHASAEFSRENYDKSDEELIEQLVTDAQEFLNRGSIVESQVRRWRFSQPSVTCEKPFVVASTTPPLVVAGDSMLESKVEGAFQSGLQAAKWLRGQLAKPH